MLFAKFSTSGEHVYCFSSSKNLYIYDKKSGKLVSLIMIPIAKAEVNGMFVGFDLGKREESMVVHDFDELFKLDSNV
jgi:hypothetical protein